MLNLWIHYSLVLQTSNYCRIDVISASILLNTTVLSLAACMAAGSVDYFSGCPRLLGKCKEPYLVN
jgi:hypothetical protein